jgi:hypothetical protein
VAVGPREWSHIDKSTWPAGPWQSEPDKIQWVDPATGLDALMVRHESYGHWCGYVGVAEGHPAFGKGYDAVDAEVHGGLTFADACQEDAAEGHGVCHIPEPGRPEHIWWLGFDCAHAYDLSPAPRGLARLFGDSSTYRDRAYVEAEIADLARQLAALS